MDIAMCKNQECPFKEECLRATATPNLPYQWYNMFEPEEDEFGVATCDYFIHDSRFKKDDN